MRFYVFIWQHIIPHTAVLRSHPRNIILHKTAKYGLIKNSLEQEMPVLCSKTDRKCLVFYFETVSWYCLLYWIKQCSRVMPEIFRPQTLSLTYCTVYSLSIWSSLLFFSKLPVVLTLYPDYSHISLSLIKVFWNIILLAGDLCRQK